MPHQITPTARRVADHGPLDAAGRRPGASRYPDSGRPVQRLSTDDLWSRRSEPSVRDELVRRFVPLATRLATRYRTPREPVHDLVQVACLGLLRAVDRFDPDRGPSFASYAIPTILGELKRYFRDTGWAVRVPRGAQELALRVDKAVHQLTDARGRAPAVDELAEFLELEIDEVVEALQASNARYGRSLEAPVAFPAEGDDGDAGTLADTLGEEDDRYSLVETTLDLAAGLRHLPPAERAAMDLRLRHHLKQREIAERMGCSQMQVSRLLARAADRLLDIQPPV